MTEKPFFGPFLAILMTETQNLCSGFSFEDRILKFCTEVVFGYICSQNEFQLVFTPRSRFMTTNVFLLVKNTFFKDYASPRKATQLIFFCEQIFSRTTYVPNFSPLGRFFKELFTKNPFVTFWKLV